MRAKVSVLSSTALPVVEEEPNPELDKDVGVAEGAVVAVGAAKTRPSLVMALEAGAGMGTAAVGGAESITEASLGSRARASSLLAGV